MLQGGGQVDLLHTLRQTVQYHIDQAVGACTVTAVRTVHYDRRGFLSIGLVNFPV